MTRRKILYHKLCFYSIIFDKRYLQNILLLRNTYIQFQSTVGHSTAVKPETMNHSDEKVRLRITSPTLDESDDFSSMTRNSGERSKLPQAQSNPHQYGLQRVDREDSPTDR